jgi:hypothetical protein
MTAQTQAAPIEVPEDVQAFAVEQKVEAYLPAVLETARRVFPPADIHVYLEDDPEIENDCHIIIHVKAPYLTVEQAMEANDAYVRGLFAVCPAPLICVFRLRLELG